MFIQCYLWLFEIELSVNLFSTWTKVICHRHKCFVVLSNVFYWISKLILPEQITPTQLVTLDQSWGTSHLAAVCSCSCSWPPVPAKDGIHSGISRHFSPALTAFWWVRYSWMDACAHMIPPPSTVDTCLPRKGHISVLAIRKADVNLVRLDLHFQVWCPWHIVYIYGKRSYTMFNYVYFFSQVYWHTTMFRIQFAPIFERFDHVNSVDAEKFCKLQAG